MNSLEKAARAALAGSLHLKRNEKVLIVTDRGQREIALSFFEASRKISSDPVLVEISPGSIHGEEPPRLVAEAMKGCDVALLVTTMSLSHTAARREATGAGTRIASMPGISAGMMRRCIDVDYRTIKRLTNRLADILDAGKIVEVTTELGTAISMSIEGRQAHGRNGGVFRKPGSWGNLPEGEACISPVEGTAEGCFLIDISIPLRKELLRRPIRVTVKEGYAVKISGSKRLANAVKEHGPLAANIAELGIGTNYKARPGGTVLEDEKVLGTCHIALGNNMSLGGKVNAPIHLDGVIGKPTIMVDGRAIMKRGKLVV